MIEQTGVVISVQGEVAEVQAERRGACGGCAADGSCGPSLVARYLGRKPSLLRAHNPIGATSGDRVVVGLPEGTLLRASFLAYLAPLVCMMGAAIAGDQIARLLFPAHVEGLSVLAGVGGLAAALLWLAPLGAFPLNEQNAPRILRPAGRFGESLAEPAPQPDLARKPPLGLGRDDRARRFEGTSVTKKSFLLAAICLVYTLLAWPPATFARSLPELAELVEAYGPAVVNISTKQSRQHIPTFRGFSIPDLPEDSPLYEFFRRFLDEEEPVPHGEEQSRSLGSGFVISADGYLLTDAHVVEDADEIIVRTSDRREFLAELVGTDKRSDIALLKVEAKDLPPVKIGSAKDLRVGEWVLAIGSPFGFEHSATAGIVSAKGRSLPSENYVPFIQTDVAINPGNSGGPLFNLDGEVVGVNSQIYSRTGGFMGLSFAIPIEMAMDVVEQLKTTGHVSRGWLGVLIQDVTRDLAETFGMEQPKGALIAQVLPNSPAEKAGLQVGDVVVRFDGKEVPTSSALPPLVGASPVNKPRKVEVVRGGRIQEVTVVIGELPEEGNLAVTEESEHVTANRLGLVVDDLDADQRDQLGLEQPGVIVQDVKPGAAERAGIGPGDVILMFNNRPVKDAKQFGELLESIEPGRSVAALIQRGDGRLFLAIRMPKD
jgi:serine protease Do